MTIPFQSYQSTWQNPYLPLTNQGQPVTPMAQPYMQPVNGITKVATHAIMEEAGINDLLRQLPCGPVLSEETLAWFLESHAVEAVDAVSRMLGRRVCVDGTCLGG